MNSELSMKLDGMSVGEIMEYVKDLTQDEKDDVYRWMNSHIMPNFIPELVRNRLKELDSEDLGLLDDNA